ncbi:hypothetical protein ACFW4K_26510 [Nocardiopsis alba]|uniref:Gp37-like protein n=1 Tax=Nocardiopsis alba TaxID=53437 RepID=UPI00366C4562
MGTRRIQVYSRDPDLVNRGPLPWRNLTLDLLWSGVSSFGLTLTASERVRSRIAPGWGVIVTLDDRVLLAGQIEESGPREWSVEAGDLAGEGRVDVSGADDLAVVAGELAYPDPSLAATGQGEGSDRRSGAAESVIKGFVGANIGASRTSARRGGTRTREVEVAPDLGRGPQVAYSARFEPLMDVVRSCSGGLGARVTWSGDRLVFDVAEPVDRSASARFSRELGNLRSMRWQQAMPTATHVLVTAEDQDENTFVREYADVEAAERWRTSARVIHSAGRVEEVDELDAVGAEQLADARRAPVLEARLVDTSRCAFGRDYFLGDTVALEPVPGVRFTDPVTEVRISADADSGALEITPTIGAPLGDSADDTEQERLLRRALRRIAALERKS